MECAPRSRTERSTLAHTKSSNLQKETFSKLKQTLKRSKSRIFSILGKSCILMMSTNNIWLKIWMITTWKNKSYHVLRDTGSLQFIQSESASTTILNVVFVGGAPNNGTKGLNWSWGNLGGLSSTSLSSPFLSCGLVEPCFYVPIPILVEMGIWHHLISFGRHGGCWGCKRSRYAIWKIQFSLKMKPKLKKIRTEIKFTYMPQQI